MNTSLLDSTVQGQIYPGGAIVPLCWWRPIKPPTDYAETKLVVGHGQRSKSNQRGFIECLLLLHVVVM